MSRHLERNAAEPRRALALLPAHNEGASLEGLVRELQRLRPDLDVLVVDDASTDATPEILPTLPVRWLRLHLHLGVGGAMRAGLRYALGLGYQEVIRLDADGQHRPDLARLLLDALRQHQADAVLGSRYKAPTGYRTPAARRLAQRVLATSLSVLTGRPVTDPTSGFWAFGPRAIRLLAEHHPTGYAEPELTLLLSRNGLSVHEVPVEMRDRTAGESTLTLTRASAAVARAVLAMVMVPLRAPVKEGHD
jgi:glycosyltransferase involved in cell wall biosynthesis